MNRYASNIWKYYVLRFVSSLELTVSIYVLFLLANNLSMVQVMLLETILMVTVLCLELPSGIFADHYGRKASLMISLLCATLAFVVFGFGTSFLSFLVANLLIAIGWSFESGAGEAFVYDTLKECNKEHGYATVYGRSGFIASFTWALSGLISGALAIYVGYRALFFATALVFFLSFLLASSLREPPLHKKVADKKYYTHFKNSLSFVKKTPAVFNLIFFFSLFAGVTHLVWFLIQPYYVSTFVIGIATFLYFGLNALGSLTATFFMRKFSKQKLLFSMLLVSSLSLVSLYFVRSFYGLVFVALMSFASGIREVYVSSGVHESTRSFNRATVGSVQNFSKGLFYAIFAPILGYVTDVFDPATSFLMLGVTLSLFFVYHVILYLRKSLVL